MASGGEQHGNAGHGTGITAALAAALAENGFFNTRHGVARRRLAAHASGVAGRAAASGGIRRTDDISGSGSQVWRAWKPVVDRWRKILETGRWAGEYCSTSNLDKRRTISGMMNNDDGKTID